MSARRPSVLERARDALNETQERLKTLLWRGDLGVDTADEEVTIHWMMRVERAHRAVMQEIAKQRRNGAAGRMRR